MFISSFRNYVLAAYLSIFGKNYIDEKVIRIPKKYKWTPSYYKCLYQRIWIPEKLQYIVRKTVTIKYDRDQVNRKFNKILLQELTINAKLETEIKLVDENSQNDLIGTDSEVRIFDFNSFDIILMLSSVILNR